MMNNMNYNINNSDDNNTRNLPPPTPEHVLAIQGQLFQTMVLMHQTILRMQSTDERTSQERGRMILRVKLAMHKMNRLRSNSRSLELNKLIMTIRYDA
jgi:hypothetical protein